MTVRDQTTVSSDRLMQAEAWVFDLDNTLYPASSNLFEQVDRKMTMFIADFLDLDPKDARALQKIYFLEHGTTLRGLMNLHGLDPRRFLAYVHDIDLSPVSRDPTLDRALTRLPGRKIVFTNGPEDHAHRVMDRLSIRHHFEAVFDIIEADYVPKPDPEVYAALVRRHRLAPEKTVMVEDLARNLAPAAALGMTTVWVRGESAWSRESEEGDGVHHVIDDLAGWLGELTAPRGTGRPVRSGPY